MGYEFFLFYFIFNIKSVIVESAGWFHRWSTASMSSANTSRNGCNDPALAIDPVRGSLPWRNSSLRPATIFALKWSSECHGPWSSVSFTAECADPLVLLFLRFKHLRLCTSISITIIPSKNPIPHCWHLWIAIGSVLHRSPHLYTLQKTFNIKSYWKKIKIKTEKIKKRHTVGPS